MIEKILRLTHLRVSDQNHISLMKNHTSIKAKLDTHNIGWLRQLSKKFTVNQPLLSVKQVLLSRLQTILELSVLDSLGRIQQIQQEHTSLHLAKDYSSVLYVWAIAFRLSGVKNIPTLEIANILATLIRSAQANIFSSNEMECWAQNQLGITINLLQEFTVKVVPPGWIHLQITEPAIAAWLQYIILAPPQLRTQENHQLTQITTSDLFAVQYAHARCCSLLQMAHREKLITLKKSADFSSKTFIIAPNLPGNQPRYHHVAERTLISQLIGILDDLYYSYTSHKLNYWEQAALNLSQAFQAFYSNCPIWGEVKIQTPQLAQARLRLVMATQSVLRLLLQDKLSAEAPWEL